MYLSKAQVDGLSDIVGDEVTVIHPAMVAFFMENGLLKQELFGWSYSEKARQWLEETRIENERLKEDFSDNKFATDKREAFSNSDEPIVKPKRKDPMSYRHPVEVKYKEIK